MAQRLESFEDKIKMSTESTNRHDVLREGIICFLVKNMIIPVRFCSPPSRFLCKKDTYYYVFYS